MDDKEYKDGKAVLHQLRDMTDDDILHNPAARAAIAEIGKMAEQDGKLSSLEGSRGRSSRSHNLNLDPDNKFNDTEKLGMQILRDRKGAMLDSSTISESTQRDVIEQIGREHPDGKLIVPTLSKTNGQNRKPFDDGLSDQIITERQPADNRTGSDLSRREELMMQEAAKPASLKLAGDFSDERYNADKDKGKHFDNADFRNIPGGLFEAAKRQADELMQYANKSGIKLEDTELGQIAEAVGHTQKVTANELAAVLLAKSMRVQNESGMTLTGPDKISVTFNNHVDIDLSKKANPLVDVSKAPAGRDLGIDDPHMVFELARRALQDARPQDVSSADRISPSTAAADIASHTFTTAKC